VAQGELRGLDMEPTRLGHARLARFLCARLNRVGNARGASVRRRLGRCQRFQRNPAATMSAYLTPTVTRFSSVLFIRILILIPTQRFAKNRARMPWCSRRIVLLLAGIRNAWDMTSWILTRPQSAVICVVDAQVRATDYGGVTSDRRCVVASNL
jgi:hypothetical protein